MKISLHSYEILDADEGIDQHVAGKNQILDTTGRKETRRQLTPFLVQHLHVQRHVDAGIRQQQGKYDSQHGGGY